MRSRDAAFALGVVAACAYAAFALSPALGVSWDGDDAQYSYVNFALAARHETLWDAIARANALWLHENGRLYPLSIAQKYVWYHIFTDPAAYKATLIGLTLAALAAFAYVARDLAGPRVAALATSIAAAALPLRAYHDANLAYAGEMQLIFLATLASLAAWRRAQRARGGARAGFAALALALYAATGLTYEMTYAFVPLYACVAAIDRPWRRALVSAWPFAFVALALAAASLALRAHVTLATDGNYALGAAPAAYARTLAIQFVAGLPLAYALLDPHRILPRLAVIATLGAKTYADRIPVALLLGAAAYATLRALGTASSPRPHRTIVAAAALALGLAILPAVLMSGVVKYQREAVLGVGYLPAFVQGFGVALAIALALGTRVPVAALALGLAVVADLTAGANALVAQTVRDELASRPVFERALRRGLLDRVPPGAVLVLPRLSWLCDPLRAGCPDDLVPAYLVFGLTGKRYETAAPGDAYANAAAYAIGYRAGPDGVRVTVARSGGPQRNAAAYLERSSGAFRLLRSE